MAKVIAIGNQKGGTGKTSTAYALGEVLAGKYGLETLLVDLDPQASLTRAAGVDPEKRAAIDQVLRGEASIGQAVHKLSKRLLLAASRLEVTGIELALAGMNDRTQVLAKALEPAKKAVEVIILDLPPSLSLLTVGGLTAADGVIIPARPTMLDVAGLSLFLDTLEKAKRLNPDLEVIGVLLTFYDPRIISMGKIIDQLEDMGLEVFDTRIGQSIRVAEAAENGQSVVSYAPVNKRAQEYIEFGREVYQWLKK